ncbi:MAG: HIG1 domain-containing protein [Sphingomonadaceae bacterium]
MNTILIILIVLAALTTAYILIKGVLTMARGKDATGEKSNKLMSQRVMFQAITILLVIILLVIMRMGNGS